MTIDELRDFFSNDRVATYMGCTVIEADSNHSVVEIDIEEKHLNGNNCVQGGVMFTLADFTSAVTANADEIAFVSAEGNISFLNSTQGNKLIAEATVIKRGKTLVFCDVVINDDNNKIIAKASFTMCRVK